MSIKLLGSVLIFTLIFSFSNLMSQDDELANLGFEEEPAQEVDEVYFGIGGGLTGTMLFANFDDLNDFIKTSNLGFDDKEVSSPYFMLGGEVFSVPIVFPNYRLSFFWQSSLTNFETIQKINNIDYERNLDYTLSFGGFSIDRAFIPMKSLALMAGVSLGWGNVELELSQGQSEISWKPPFNQADPNNFINRAESSFYYLQPHINLEYALTSFFIVRIGAGYNLAFSGDWTYNHRTNIKDVPEKIGKPDGLVLNLGLFMGLFNY